MGLTKAQINNLPDGTVWLHQTTYENIDNWGRNSSTVWGKIYGWGSRIFGKGIWYVTKSAFMHTGVIHDGKQWHWLGGKGLTNDYHPVSTAFLYKPGLTFQQHKKGTSFLENADTSYNYGRVAMLVITIWEWVKNVFNHLKWFFFSLKGFGENCSAGATKYLKAMGIDAIIDLIEDLETPKDIYDRLKNDDRFIMVGEDWDNYDAWKQDKDFEKRKQKNS